MNKPVIIFGAKGIARAAHEIFESNGVVVYGFLDPDKNLHSKEINTVPVLGDPDDTGLTDLIGDTCEAFVASDDNALREEQVEFLTNQRKVMPTNAVHKAALIPESASIGHGNFINARCVLGAGAAIGQHNILHTGCVLEHEVNIGDFVQIGSGALIGAGVEVGNKSFIGTGAILVAGIKIGENARIGAGSVVIQDVGDNETVFGNPAAKVGS